MSGGKKRKRSSKLKMDYFVENGTVFDPILIKLNDEPDGYKNVVDILSFFVGNPEVARMAILQKAIAYIIVQKKGEYNMYDPAAIISINELLREHCKLDEDSLFNQGDLGDIMDNYNRICGPFFQMGEEKLHQYLLSSVLSKQ